MKSQRDLAAELAAEVRRREEAEHTLARLNATLAGEVERQSRDLRNSLSVLRHEMALRERAEAIIQSSEDAIISKDLQSVITSWNGGAERMYGYTGAEMVGRRITLLIPADRQDEEEQILSRILQGERVRHFVTVRTRKDGLPIAVSVSVSPIKNSAGGIIGASHVARDITENKRIELALQRSEARLRHIADCMPVIVWAARPDGSVSYYNRRWYEFIGGAEGAGEDRNWRARLHADDVETAETAWKRALGSGTAFRMDFRIREAGTGEYRWFAARSVPIDEGTGDGMRWYGTFADIHELKLTQQELVRAREFLEERVEQRTAQLESANQDLDAFAYSVSHDLRAPLRVIGGYAGMLLEDYEASVDARGRRLLQMVRSETQRAGQLIDGLLAFARLGRGTLSRSRIGMTALARDAWREARAAEPQLEVEFRLSPLPVAFGDPTLLRQVFVNLLSNALKFTRHCGAAVIDVTGGETAEEVIYTVCDNGAGFDMAYADQLFAVFHRLHTPEEYEGNGVGLSIVKRILQQHGGRVWGEGRLQEGATFRFALPRAVQPPEEKR